MIRRIPGVVRELAGIPGYHRHVRGVDCEGDWCRVDYGAHPRQYALVAEQPDPLAPVAVWWHGGGWQFGSPDLLVAFGEYFYRRGYTVWLPSHRRLPANSGRVVYADALKALRLAQRSASVPPRLLLGGTSSGGHLAMLCALRREGWLRGGRIEAVVTKGAPLSLRHLGQSPTRRFFAGHHARPGFRALDPLAQLREDPGFPALVLHGTRDGLVPYECGLAFQLAARRVGWRDCDLVTLPGATHLDTVRCMLEL